MMNRKTLTLALLAGLVVFAAPSLEAAPGQLDTAFGTAGKASFSFGNCLGSSLAVQADGKLVVGGRAFVASTDFALVRFHANGSVDTNFGTGGKVTTDFKGGEDFITRVRVLDDGKILAAGTSSGDGGKDFSLARYNSDGTLDTTFDPVGHDGKVSRDFGSANDETANDMVVQPDGKILVVGYANKTLNDSDFGIIRFNADGSTDTNFGSGGIAMVDFSGKFDVGTSVALQPDGKILVAGYSVISGYQFSLARLNSDGTLDTTFDGDGKVTSDLGNQSFDYGETVLVLNSGKILVGGQSNGGFALVRYQPNGSLDTTFGNTGVVLTQIGAASTIYALSELGDGKILAAGDGDNDFALACYTADGAPDTTFGSAGKITTDFSGNTDQCRGLVVLGNGDILLAGTADFSDFAVARYAAALSSASAANAPKLTLSGKKKRLALVGRAVIRGIATGEVTSVTYKLGKRTRVARGTSAWKFVARLKPGRNVITVVAHGPGGDSAPVKVIAIRR